MVKAVAPAMAIHQQSSRVATPVPAASADAWYLLYTKPHQEQLAQDNLANQGYQTYLPLLQTLRRRNRRYRAAVVPMFPRYLFIHLNAGSDNWGPIRSTLGVMNFVRFGAVTPPVPPELIAYLRSREDAQGLHTGHNEGLRVGDRVRIIEGLGRDYEGIVTAAAGKERVRLLLDVLAQEVGVVVSRHSVKKVS